MNEQEVHVYTPSMDGEYVPVSFTSKDLKDEEVFIILDEYDRHIFIWTGINSSVRKRFISSQIARQIRLEKGMTHRISTEEQGNETKKFGSLLERIAGTKLQPHKLMDVSPVAFTSHPETLKDIPAPPKKVIKKPKTKKETIVRAPTPPPTKTPSSEKKPTKKPVEVTRPDTLYFSEDQSLAISESKACLIFRKTDQNLTLTTLHISSAAKKGKIAFYYLPKSGSTASCKNKKPIFVVYLTSNTPPVLELDDLEIPIPAGNSIYYSCPASTFIGLNLE